MNDLLFFVDEVVWMGLSSELGPFIRIRNLMGSSMCKVHSPAICRGRFDLIKHLVSSSSRSSRRGISFYTPACPSLVYQVSFRAVKPGQAIARSIAGFAAGTIQGLQGVTRSYKDGLQPESLADGKLAGETKSTSVEN
jgi:hypothetical protein